MKQPFFYKFVLDVDPFDFEAPRSALISLIDWKIDNIYQPFSFRKYSLAGPGSNTKKDDLPIPDLGAFHFHGAQDVPEDQMEIVQSGLRGVQSQKIQALESFVYEISPMLFYLGHNLSSSPSLYTKLCRLLKIRMDSLDIKSCDVSQVTFANLTGDTCDNEVLNIYRIISAVLLPSLSRIDCNPAISALCWSVVSVFPFNTRFTMYEIWKGEGLGKQVFLI